MVKENAKIRNSNHSGAQSHTGKTASCTARYMSGQEAIRNGYRESKTGGAKK